MQASSVVEPMLFSDLDIDSVLNIGVKGTFKPINNENNNTQTQCENYTKLNTEKVDKVVCPYEDPESGNLPPNCLFIEQCKLKQETTFSANKPESVPKSEKPKRGRGRPRKNQ